VELRISECLTHKHLLSVKKTFWGIGRFEQPFQHVIDSHAAKCDVSLAIVSIIDKSVIEATIE
jgi:hypothetical protein